MLVFHRADSSRGLSEDSGAQDPHSSSCGGFASVADGRARLTYNSDNPIAVTAKPAVPCSSDSGPVRHSAFSQQVQATRWKPRSDCNSTLRTRFRRARCWRRPSEPTRPSPWLPFLAQFSRSPGLDSPCRSFCLSVGLRNCRGKRDGVSARPYITLYSA